MNGDYWNDPRYRLTELQRSAAAVRQRVAAEQSALRSLEWEITEIKNRLARECHGGAA